MHQWYDLIANVSANDVSFNDIVFLGKIYQNDGTEFVGGAGAVNNSNQTFFEAITQQPYQFTKYGDKNTAAFIDINWNYDDILVNTASNVS